MTKADFELLLQETAEELGYIGADAEAAMPRVGRYLRSGMAELDQVAGEAVDYNTDLTARALLMDYCRHANGHATELFRENYLSELTSMSDRYAIRNAGGDNDAEG